MEDCAASQSEGRTVSSNHLELTVNQWVLDYYFYCALDAFKSGRHDDFAEIRDIVSVIIQRPLESTEENSRKLRIMQCLSRIEEGEDPDCTFEKDSSETPLESAVGILDIIQNEIPLDEDLLRTNKQMVKEAAVVVCIKKKQFDKAVRILRKYISKYSKQKLRKELKAIIQEQNLKHPIIANFSFSTIKKKIYQLFESHIEDTAPFLLTIAQKEQNLGSLSRNPQTPDGHSEQRTSSPIEKDPPSTPQIVRSQTDNRATYSLSIVKSKFKLLCQDKDPDVIFKNLCEMDFCRRNTAARSSVNKRTCMSRSPLHDRSGTSIFNGNTKRLETLNQQDIQCEDGMVSSKAPNLQSNNTDLPEEKQIKQDETSKRRKLNSVCNPSDAVEVQDTWSEEDQLFREMDTGGERVDQTWSEEIRLKGMVFLTGEVVYQITHKVSLVLACNPIPAKKVTSLVGKLISTIEAVPFAMAHTRKLRRFVIQVYKGNIDLLRLLVSLPLHVELSLLVAVQIEHNVENLSKEPQTPDRLCEQRTSSPIQNDPPSTPQLIERLETDISSTYSLSILKYTFKLLSQEQNPDIIFQGLCEMDFCMQGSPTRSPKNKRLCTSGISSGECTGASILKENTNRLETLNQQVIQCEDGMETTNASHQQSNITDPPKQKEHNENNHEEAALKKSNKNRKMNFVLDNSDMVEERDTWSDEDELFKAKKGICTASTGKRQKWTQEESEWIRRGVKKFGEGNWKLILYNYPFYNRTSVMIKDRWRTMKKLGIDSDR
ncbi:telomeric repeat-binding factor 2 [Rhinophrynus dorsalis]